MGKKKATTPATNSAQPALKIGSRVRCGDGACGRITWANAVAVKIKWENGEEITQRRDALAWLPIEILGPEEAAEAAAQPEQVPVHATSDQAVATPPLIPESEAAAPVAEPAAATAVAEPIPAAEAPPAT